MKKETIFLLILSVLLLPVSVIAICGDFRCDPEEGKRFCKTDCLMAGDYCCSDMTCQECESLICKRGVCKPYNIVDQVKIDDIACFPDGSVMMYVAFEKFPGRETVISRDIRVEFKMSSQFAALSELKGDWYYGGNKVTDIKRQGYHTFSAQPGQISSDGSYVVRVKYKSGEKNQFGIDKEFTCSGIEVPQEPEEESVEYIIKEEEVKIEEIGKDVEGLKEGIKGVMENVENVKSQVETQEEKRKNFEEQIISILNIKGEGFRNAFLLIIAVLLCFTIVLIHKLYSKKKKKTATFK